MTAKLTAVGIAPTMTSPNTTGTVGPVVCSQGLLVNAAPDGPVNHDPEIDGLRAAGVVVNCPPIFVALPT